MRDTLEYAGQANQFGAAGHQEKKSKVLLVVVQSFMALVMLCAIAFGGYFAYRYAPDKVNELIIKIDRFGITDMGKREQYRINQIEQLPITYAEKQVLLDRTVFLGATPQMVKLALGTPKQEQTTGAVDRGNEVITYIYHFSKDSRPTLLRFENQKLTSAGKASTIDVN
jgi:hypothetical protein